MRTGLAILLACWVGTTAHADEEAAGGRRISEQYKEAVVTVRLVLDYDMSFGGRSQQKESKTETLGTVIDPSGLTVVSFTSIDQSEMWKAQTQSSQMKIESSVKSAKIALADGSEIEAQIVLRDKDLDLAFLRPVQKPAKPLAFVDLSRSGKAQMLDQVVCLNRLGKIADRAVEVSLERVAAVVTKPRTFYLLGLGGSSGIGSPVFTLAGESVGMLLLRTAKADSEPNAVSVFSGTSASGLLPVVIPASDIEADAKQALVAKSDPVSGD